MSREGAGVMLLVGVALQIKYTVMFEGVSAVAKDYRLALRYRTGTRDRLVYRLK